METAKKKSVVFMTKVPLLTAKFKTGIQSFILVINNWKMLIRLWSSDFALRE